MGATNYAVWCADNDTEDDARIFPADSPEEAVEDFAEYCYAERDGWEWMRDGADFFVREAGGKTVKYFVDVEFTPYFNARKAVV